MGKIMPAVSEMIKHVASELNRRVLKPKGFRKAAMTWVRGSPWVQIINIQSGKWNTPSEGTFTLNLGLYVPELHAATEAWPVSGSVKEYDCDVRRRIGELMASAEDYWWEVTPTTELEPVIMTVCESVEAFAIPWLDRTNQSMENVAAELAHSCSFLSAAVAFALAGDKTAASQALANALANSNPSVLPKLRRLAAAHGLAIQP